MTPEEIDALARETWQLRDLVVCELNHTRRNIRTLLAQEQAILARLKELDAELKRLEEPSP